MKKNVALIVLLIVVKINIAQDYHPIDFYNSGWNNVGWILGGSGFPEKADLYNCYFVSDTLIANNTYHTYYYDRTRYDFNTGNNIIYADSNTYIGAMRTDSKRYYFIPKDSLEERLIYDFNLSLNDTVPLGFYPAPAKYKIIDDTSTITLNDGTTRMEYRANLLDSQGNLVGICWYDEGLGDTKSLVHPDLYAIQSYDGGFERLSYCENGELQYHHPGFWWDPGMDCDFTVSVRQWTLGSNNHLMVIPNPIIENSFSFELKTTINFNKEYNLNIYNYLGQEIYSEIIQLQSNSLKSLNIDLNPGMYVLILTDSDNTTYATKIVKSR